MPSAGGELFTVLSDVCGGHPCVRGLRIRVKDVLDLLAAGASREEIPLSGPRRRLGADREHAPSKNCFAVSRHFASILDALERGETLVEVV